MSKEPQPSFSDTQLFLAELFQYYPGRTRAGRRIVEKSTGGNPDYYDQLLWLPRYKVKYQDVHSLVTVQGDAEAEGSATNWTRGAIISAPKEAFDLLRENHPWPEAVGFRSVNSKVLHVGTTATHFGTKPVLSEIPGLDEDRLGIAVRRGKGDADFTLGIDRIISRRWRGFAGVLWGVEAHYIDVADIPEISPALRLV